MLSMVFRIVGLKSQVSETFLGSGSDKCDPTIEHQVRLWLCQNLPDWSSVQIKGAAKYLGLFLGPSAGESSWTQPFLKYTSRAKALSSSFACGGLAQHTYNIKIITTLSYVAQLQFLPSEALRCEA